MASSADLSRFQRADSFSKRALDFSIGSRSKIVAQLWAKESVSEPTACITLVMSIRPTIIGFSGSP